MAEGNLTRTKRKGTLRLYTDAGDTYTVAFEPGNLNLAVPGPTIAVSLDRGEFGDPPDVALVDDQEMTFTFDARLRSVSPSDVATLKDFITRSGVLAASWTSTLGALREVFLVHLEWLIEGSGEGETDETITCKHCWITGSIEEGDVDVLHLSGRSIDVYPDVAAA